MKTKSKTTKPALPGDVPRPRPIYELGPLFDAYRACSIAQLDDATAIIKRALKEHCNFDCDEYEAQHVYAP